MTPLHAVRSGAATLVSGVGILFLLRLLGIAVDDLHLLTGDARFVYIDVAFWIGIVAYVNLGMGASTVARLPGTGSLATLAWLACIGFFVTAGMSVAIHFLSSFLERGILGAVYNLVWNAVFIAAWSCLVATTLLAARYAGAPAPPCLAMTVVVTLVLSRMPELLGMFGVHYPWQLRWVFRILLFAFYGVFGGCLVRLVRVKDRAPTGWPPAWQ